MHQTTKIFFSVYFSIKNGEIYDKCLALNLYWRKKLLNQFIIKIYDADDTLCIFYYVSYAIIHC